MVPPREYDRALMGGVFAALTVMTMYLIGLTTGAR
jgi:hypothetical protein